MEFIPWKTDLGLQPKLLFSACLLTRRRQAQISNLDKDKALIIRAGDNSVAS